MGRDTIIVSSHITHVSPRILAVMSKGLDVSRKLECRRQLLRTSTTFMTNSLLNILDFGQYPDVRESSFYSRDDRVYENRTK